MSSEKPESGESFAALFEKEAEPARRKRVRVGDRLEAVVVQVGRDAVFLELDGKQQAFMDAVELRDEDGTLSVAEGEILRAHVVEVDEARGVVRLGRSIGKPGSLAAVEQAKETGVAVEGKVTGVNKGGLEVDLGGVRAFCPMSQAHDRFVDDAASLVGQILRFLVTDVRDGGKNVVVSRRALLQREASDSAAKTLASVERGAILRGTVTSVRDFGAFVDLGGVEGMIPRSEIAHDRSVAVADALKPGDVVEVQVREIKEPEAGASGGGSRRPQAKITLSLKALAADPWSEIDLAPGRVVAGTVVRSTEFGRFVRLAPGVEGLLHVSELGRDFKGDEGEELRVVVKKVDREAKKISLVPAPEGAALGATLPTTLPGDMRVGAIIQGTVERIEAYGIFVQVEGTKGRAGRGLVPNVELGVPRGTDIRKTFPEGSKVTAKILETGEGKLRLSVKAAKDAEERADYEAARGKQGAPKSLGTFADLLKGRKL
jgi:small subunit ribosomal protein S1